MTYSAPIEIRIDDGRPRVAVCTGSGCVAQGSQEVADAFEAAIAAAGAEKRLRVVRTGCHGICRQGPVVTVGEDGVFYPKATPESAPRIIEAFLAHEIADEHLYREYPDSEPVTRYEHLPFNAMQLRIALRNCGYVDPENIDEALDRGAYEGLRRVLDEADPEGLIAYVASSGIRGRGGAGFPTATKWRFGREAEGERKVVIANGDEGDPGAFMDRSILEGDPHALVEGLAVAAYAVGANEAIVYCRAEYPLAVRRVRTAIEQATERGFLGDDVLGSGWSLEMRVMEGAGAFVCGEETALIASIEGRRGMPRLRPPYPTTSGLWGRPTVINNVETLSCVPWILTRGAAAFSAIGSERSKGTKVFALTGKVKHTGLIEVPMGTPLRTVVFDVGGGVPDGRAFKGVQIGGPAGGCLPAAFLDTPVDYESLTSSGAMMGSGGLVVLDDTTCVVELARYFLAFSAEESCGQCTACRVGTTRLLEMLERITAGEAEEDVLGKLESLAEDIAAASLCGLGQGAPNPLLTTLRYFRDEYEAHVREKRCPAGQCAALTPLAIDDDACRRCSACLKACPADAISVAEDGRYSIDQQACTRCRACVNACPSSAIGSEARAEA